MDFLPLLSDDYLHSIWQAEYESFRSSGDDGALLKRLKLWVGRDKRQTEVQLESQFVTLFFKDIWTYWGTGERAESDGFCLHSQFAVQGAGQTGGIGAADLALGWWGRDGIPAIPQVLCEFKDIRSSLDAPQRRKGNDRSPVKQCFDYLKYAFDGTPAESTVFPTWGIVTDMNEFRLYARQRGDSQCQRFFLVTSDPKIPSLTGTDDEASFQRFVFSKLFRRDLLVTESGKCPLERLLGQQLTLEKQLEKEFYLEYQSYRQTLYEAVVEANPEFQTTRGKLVKLAQRFLDRCIFILFCEDMGKSLNFPKDLLRDILIEESKGTSYDPSETDIWVIVKRLFHAMRDGGSFPPDHSINRFNGGLFEPLPDLENLRIPNRVFCAKSQGASLESIASHKNTLLYLAANYNFGAHGPTHERTVSLYALGRIFEQSITDLEYMEAEAENKETIATLTKRKRDGVYYTPEWVTDYIVKETIGARLRDLREGLSVEIGAKIPLAELRAFQDSAGKRRRPNNSASRAIQALDAYQEALKEIKIVDPACGSGAFLIQALDYLHGERRSIAEERNRINGTETFFDDDAEIRDILSRNLYGVDINPESVEITQLALWLKTARPGKPLSNLDTHIVCGNSLVGPDFRRFFNDQNTRQNVFYDDLDEQTQEDLNIFDWETAFPEIFGPDVPEEKRGFDCVIGNPPYVKLQNFRKLKPHECNYYVNHKRLHNEPTYDSAQTGNFDLYLLFIEKGISLLNYRGRMGYIAPSLWLKNEYGEGLRKLVKRLRCLDRWIDFKSYQVFQEATTYTALQFFTGKPCENIRFQIVPDGDITPIDWTSGVQSVPYSSLPNNKPWNISSKSDSDLIEKLLVSCRPLEDKSYTRQIFQGLITSADYIYHLDRVAPGLYRQTGAKSDGIVHKIEDPIMHCLVSGPDAKRYVNPASSTYILFPYNVDAGGAHLLSQDAMSALYPNAWQYLKRFERVLRARERGRFDDADWYRFGRNQNLDKQAFKKLGVSETVRNMRVFADQRGEFYFNNVRVNGIIPAQDSDLFFLLGVLNSNVVDFVFRRIAKPKSGGYYEANKQYIAPLPIPPASSEQKAAVGERAERLQDLHTKRRDLVADLQRRLDSDQCFDNERDPDWLWAEVGDPARWKNEAPLELTGKKRTEWGKKKFESLVGSRLERIEAVLRPGVPLRVESRDGEIRFCANGHGIVTVYDDDPFVLAQWRQVARKTHVTEKFTAKSLIKSLLSLRDTKVSSVRSQVVKLDQEIEQLDSIIAEAEKEMNALIYRLYDLTEEEVELVEAG